MSSPEKFIVIVFVGDRKQSGTLTEFVTRQKKIFVSKQKPCARGAFANGLKAAAESGVAKEFMKKNNKTVKVTGSSWCTDTDSNKKVLHAKL